MSRSDRQAFRMSRSGREALPHVREWSGGPPACPGEARSPSRLAESGREAFTGGWEAFPDGRVWTGGLTGGREAHPDVREWSGDPPKCQGGFGRQSWMCGSGREPLLDVRECSGCLPGCP